MHKTLSDIPGFEALATKLHDEIITLRSGLPHSIDDAVARMNTIGEAAEEMYGKLKQAKNVKLTVEVDDNQGQALGSTSASVDVTKEVAGAEAEIKKAEDAITGSGITGSGPAVSGPAVAEGPAPAVQLCLPTAGDSKPE